MKKVILPLVAFMFSQYSNAQEDFFEKATTNQEIIEIIEDQSDKLNKFINFFANTDSEKGIIKAYPYKINFNKAKFDQMVNESKLYSFTFLNTLDKGKNEITLFKDPYIYDSFRNLGAVIFATKVKYFDGTEVVLPNQIQVNTHFGTNLHLNKPIENLTVKLHFSAITQIDSVIIPVELNKTIQHNGFTYTVIAQNKNSLTIKTNATEINFIATQAITTSNQRVKSSSSSTTNLPPNEYKNLTNSLTKQAQKLLASAKKDSLMPFDVFKTKYNKKINQLINNTRNVFFGDDESNIEYLTYNFGPAVKTVILYYATHTDKRVVEKNIPLQHKQDLLFDVSADNQLQVFDTNSALLKTFDTEFYRINDYYYEGNTQYAHYNKAQNQVNKLSHYSIKNLVNNYVLTQADDESDVELYDANHNKIMNVDSYVFDDDFDLALIQSNNKFYILNKASHTPIEIKNVDEVTYAEKGYFIVQKNNKYGFVNSNANLIVPIMYDDAIAFSDMADVTPQDHLFGVKKAELWGFVDANNKTVIPFIYSNLNGPFSYGIAPVYLDGKLGLINLQNQKLTQFINSNYGNSSNFGKRAFSLADGDYNYKGERENRE